MSLIQNEVESWFIVLCSINRFPKEIQKFSNVILRAISRQGQLFFTISFVFVRQLIRSNFWKMATNGAYSIQNFSLYQVKYIAWTKNLHPKFFMWRNNSRFPFTEATFFDFEFQKIKVKTEVGQIFLVNNCT